MRPVPIHKPVKLNELKINSANRHNSLLMRNRIKLIVEEWIAVTNINIRYQSDRLIWLSKVFSSA